MAAFKKANPAAEASALECYWTQKTLAEANGQLFKVAKGIGSTNWHKHDDEDEVFLVLEGQFIIELRTQTMLLDEGDLFVVPKGVEHRPRADTEATVLVIGSTVTSTPSGGKPEWS